MRIALALWLAALAFSQPLPATTTDNPHTITIDGQRPLTVHTPPNYDPDEPLPLLLVLHGYAASGEAIENYFRFKPLIDRHRFLYVHPDGTHIETAQGKRRRGWNAGPVFGNVYGHQSDDIDYLGQVLDAIETRYKVDPTRVFVVGHSNGGRMTYGLVCAYSHRITAAVSLAGTLLGDPVTLCGQPNPAPTHILHVHGTADRVTTYNSGSYRDWHHPGASGAAERWALYNGCETRPEPAPERLNIGAREPGPETQVVRYRNGCRLGGSAELWSIEGGNHMPALIKTAAGDDDDRQTTRLAERLIDWLLARAADTINYRTAAQNVE